MNTNGKSKQNDQQLFICHSVNLQNSNMIEAESKPFTTPRFKKPINTSTISSDKKRQINHKQYGSSLVYHRPFALDS